MKKLKLVLQIIGLIAICPVYVALEITHGSKGMSEHIFCSPPVIKSENGKSNIYSDTKKALESNSPDAAKR